ncbi:hypothetical protein [Ruminococcus sp.]|uniref:hypothetical protein n=1 Tax=Ruminococcus sp. TaxID=41978 RepID=UPI0025EB9338|nr:hypothetical protein [Ruminococcus sp.]MCR4638268.1 hypothetical protein [Ruminococcus sp.]
MRTVTAINQRKSAAVVIGGVTLFCESFKASAVRSITEESTADGKTVLTNNASRSTRLTFTGRVSIDGAPENAVLSFNALVNSANTFNVEHMGLVFANCRMLSYAFDDKGGDWADTAVVLTTAEPVTRRTEP